MQRLPAITHDRFSLIRFRSPLLTESRLLSLPVGTEMFHFPTFPPPTLYIQVRVTGLASSRVSPFGNPRITVWLSTPRGLSQIPTSFFGSWCQGIHRAPLKTWPQRCSRPLCSSQHTGGTPPHAAATHTPKGHGRYNQQEGPNRKHRAKNARALRTQQRAKHHPPACVTFPNPPRKAKPVLVNATDARCQLIDVPPLSNPHDHNRVAPGYLDTINTKPPTPKGQNNLAGASAP
jgi:hypothetical protein